MNTGAISDGVVIIVSSGTLAVVSTGIVPADCDGVAITVLVAGGITTDDSNAVDSVRILAIEDDNGITADVDVTGTLEFSTIDPLGMLENVSAGMVTVDSIV